MGIPLVSVIVPVFNVEKYLDNCMESIVKQTYQNLEIVLVDDGSKDSSKQKCDEWADKDRRIKVVHKENAGLGMARNTGLDNATGAYVIYVDSDDFIDTRMVQVLMDAANFYHADTVYCGFMRLYSDKQTKEFKQSFENVCFQGKDVTQKVLLRMIGSEPDESVDSYLNMSVWHGAYSMKLILENGIRFPSERIYISEDIIYHIDYLRISKCVAFVPDCLYYYRMNDMSLTKLYNPQRFDKEIVLYREIKRKLGLFLLEKDYLQRVNRMFLGRVRSCVMRAVVGNRNNAYRELEQICNNTLVREILISYPYHRNPVQQRFFNYLLSHSIVWGLWIMAYLVGKRNLSR